jgi:anthranilate phosphoribosyltransferase
MNDERWVQEALRRLSLGERIGETLVAQAFAQVMQGQATDAQVGALLAGLRVQGETADEVTGTVRALRTAMIPVQIRGPHVIDTAGTGGGTVATFNISTAAALVAVGAGARVAKHGNRSYSSRCGSADVLEALGISISVDPDNASTVVNEAGIVFLFAPAFHPAMRHVGPVRKELGITTIMNIVGPLANPAGVDRQLIGVADLDRGPIMAEALARLGAAHALVVHGEVGMDEISPSGPTTFWEVREGVIERGTIDPRNLGLAFDDLDALAGGEPKANADRIEALFQNASDDPGGRAAVALNAGAAIYVSGLVESIPDGVSAALESMETGKAATALAGFRAASPLKTSE